MQKCKRRDFLKIAGGAVAAYALPGTLAAQSDFEDYKALVIVNLAGGNDSLNMFIPADKKGYGQYSKIRTDTLMVKDEDLTRHLGSESSALKLEKEDGNPYYDGNSLSKAYIKGFYKHKVFGNSIATNALMPEVAHLMNQKKGAILYNVGNIIEPATKEDYRSGRVKIPTSYSSHLDAQKYIASGQASKLTLSSGWLGSLGDEWHGINGNSVYRLTANLSPYGRVGMLFGQKSSSINFPYRGPENITGYDTQSQKEAFDNILGLQRRDLFKKLFNDMRKSALKEVKTTLKDWESVSGDNNPFSGLQNSYGEELFNESKPKILGVNKPAYTSYLDYFKAAAKLIAIGKRRGLKRQVIYITLVGWDTHNNASELHARDLRGLSLGVGDFQKAIEHLGLEDSVTLATVSEFSRTTAINKTGTDHGWGGSQFIIGGAVKSGTYGKFPDLELGGDDDISKRGRIIPAASFSQYYATLLKWFGAKETEIDTILPELRNFAKRDLGFMKV